MSIRSGFRNPNYESMAVLVDVTAEDVAAGKRHSAQSCPIALALSRTAGLNATVGPSTVYLYEGFRHDYDLEILWEADTPRFARVILSAFDLDGLMNPARLQFNFRRPELIQTTAAAKPPKSWWRNLLDAADAWLESKL